MDLAPTIISKDYAIRVSNLSYRYGGAADCSLKDMSLAIPRGCCFGLLGPNGAGKTTLLSILTGMLSLQSGEIFINGLPAARSTEIKRVSAIVPQDLAFYPRLTGRENLQYFAGLHGLGGQEREDAIAKVVGIAQLGEVINKPSESYSGGLKRRLNLAIGLLNNPQILYLDEPTVGIDAQSRNFILEAIQLLKAAGVTIVYTSHYMEEVQAICDEVAIVDHGRVVLQSSLADLLERQGRILELRFQDEPRTDQLQELSVLGECESRGRRLKLFLNSENLGLRELSEIIDRSQLRVEHMQYGMTRLEDLYLSITKYDLRD